MPGRGRSKKTTKVDESTETTKEDVVEEQGAGGDAEVESPKKRKKATADTVESKDDEPKVKRGRGRPPKDSVKKGPYVPSGKPRGRPKKS